jgi:hypothetical protein
MLAAPVRTPNVVTELSSLALPAGLDGRYRRKRLSVRRGRARVASSGRALRPLRRLDGSVVPQPARGSRRRGVRRLGEEPDRPRRDADEAGRGRVWRPATTPCSFATRDPTGAPARGAPSSGSARSCCRRRPPMCPSQLGGGGYRNGRLDRAAAMCGPDRPQIAGAYCAAQAAWSSSPAEGMALRAAYSPVRTRTTGPEMPKRLGVEALWLSRTGLLVR